MLHGGFETTCTPRLNPRCLSNTTMSEGRALKGTGQTPLIGQNTRMKLEDRQAECPVFKAHHPLQASIRSGARLPKWRFGLFSSLVRIGLWRLCGTQVWRSSCRNAPHGKYAHCLFQFSASIRIQIQATCMSVGTPSSNYFASSLFKAEDSRLDLVVQSLYLRMPT